MFIPFATRTKACFFETRTKACWSDQPYTFVTLSCFFLSFSCYKIYSKNTKTPQTPKCTAHTTNIISYDGVGKILLTLTKFLYAPCSLGAHIYHGNNN